MQNIEEILNDANWCLGCKNRPCTEGCPMHTRIPEFIEKVKEENIEEAYQILIENNILSHVCSLICPQERQCQGSCIRGIKQTPTQIGKIEEFVNSWANANDVKPKLDQLPLKENIKVAIVGSGPAGLACSYELAKNGIKSVVFEKEKEIGGLLSYGIPDFRLDKNIVKRAIDVLKSMKVEFKTNCELGRNLSIKELKKDYDYIFLGIGAEISSTYKLTDQNIDTIYNSDEFLKAYNYNCFIKNLGKVVVIGGGNVAMDSARAAIRMGAEEVSILYRRDRNHMPAREIELEEALKDGIKFIELTRVDHANIENGKLVSVHCNRTQIIDGKAQDILNNEFDYEADSVVFAIGLKPNTELLIKEGIEITSSGAVKIDENNQTSMKNVYCGGDVVENKSVVCKAVASGKMAALKICDKIIENYNN